jgi:hypothetical protein
MRFNQRKEEKEKKNTKESAERNSSYLTQKVVLHERKEGVARSGGLRLLSHYQSITGTR